MTQPAAEWEEGAHIKIRLDPEFVAIHPLGHKAAVVVNDGDVLVSYCDDPDFDGDWRYSAFCPDLDVAMDGRTVAEALQRVKDAIAIKAADCPDGRLPALSPELKAAALADFLSDGRLVCQTTAAAAVR